MVLSLSVRILLIAGLCSASLCCLGETVLLDFSSPTCGPCQEMRPIVQRLMADGLPVRKINIEREPELATRYGVTQIPTFLVVVDGKPVDQVIGTTTYRHLHRILRRAMPASPPQQPAMPMGQSPSTFAAPLSRLQPPAAGAPILVVKTAETTAPRQNIYEPQPGRLVSLQDPAAIPTRPQSVANPFTANPFGNAPSRPALPNRGSPNRAHQDLLAATVKISVDDAQGKSAGTGTIVDARSGEALILTCGHIFRSSNGKGSITVTTFQVGATGVTPAASYSGQLIDFDLDRDLALVSMRPTAAVQSVPIATIPLAPGSAVTSVGCNHGQYPTAIDSRVTANDRYQGPPNVEVAGAPVEGRSGGGLFNAQGQLTGVCFAADPAANEGLYVALPSIHAKLDSLKLTMVYQPGAAAAQAAPVAQTPPVAARPEPQMAVRGQEPEPPSYSRSTLSIGPAVAALPAAEQSALEEIQRRGANSEVICIIRPQAPGAKSEVITLRNASPAFVRALALSNLSAPPVGPGEEQPSVTAAASQFRR